MPTFNDAQIMALLMPVFWPFLRVLGVFSSAPIFSSRSVPVRTRVALALLVALCAQAGMPDAPTLGLNDPQAPGAVLQQMVVGVAIGLAARIVFSAVELAGELIGLQMGLNFAGFFDPSTATQGTATARLFGTLVGFLFVAIQGHLLVTVAVVGSFQAFPVSAQPLAFLEELQPQVWGSEMFRLGLWIALPLVSMLLFVNLVLGIISRVASQMNIFSIGFPITLGVGLLGLLFTLPLMQTPFTHALEVMLSRFSA